jgi:hypothetical protein
MRTCDCCHKVIGDETSIECPACGSRLLSQIEIDANTDDSRLPPPDDDAVERPQTPVRVVVPDASVRRSRWPVAIAMLVVVGVITAIAAYALANRTPRDAQTQFRYGMDHARGTLLRRRDPGRALELLKLAAEAGHVEAMREIAWGCGSDGPLDGLPADDDAMLAMLWRLAAAGDAHAAERGIAQGRRLSRPLVARWCGEKLVELIPPAARDAKRTEFAEAARGRGDVEEASAWYRQIERPDDLAPARQRERAHTLSGYPSDPNRAKALDPTEATRLAAWAGNAGEHALGQWLTDAREPAVLLPTTAERLRFSSDPAKLLSVGDGGVHLWRTDTGAEMWQIRDYSNGPKRWHGDDAIFLPGDGQILVASNGGPPLTVYDAVDGRLVKSIGGAYDERTFTIDDHDGSHLIAAGSASGVVRLYDRRTGSFVRTIAGLGAVVRFNPDPRAREILGFDLTAPVVAYDLVNDTRRTIAPISRAAEFRRDGAQLLVVSADGQLLMIHPGTGTRLATVTPPTGVSQATFAPDGRVAYAGPWGELAVWDPITGGRRVAFAGGGTKVTAIAFSPDGSRVAIAGDDGLIRVRRWPPLSLAGS